MRRNHRKYRITCLAAALDLLVAAKGPTASRLLKRLRCEPDANTVAQIHVWRKGKSIPRGPRAMALLGKIEKKFELPSGCLKNLREGTGSPFNQGLRELSTPNQVMIRWHLPADFKGRSESKRSEVLDWISENILTGTTDFGKYQRRATRDKFAVVFPTLPRNFGGRRWMGDIFTKPKAIPVSGTIPAPPHLVKEVSHLLTFATSSLAPKGYLRRRRWATETAKSRILRYGAALGLFAAAPDSPIRGLGIPVQNLTLALFVFPSLWEWYLRWYENRRGFFSASELTMLDEVKSSTRNYTGWLRQNPAFAKRLKPIKGLVSAGDIRKARADWPAACDRAFEYACGRIRELVCVVRRHRDPFVPILAVLTTDRPLKEYKKIGDEIIRQLPNEEKNPMKLATAVRGYLMFRLALHLGVRQRNLRELLICLPGQKPRDTPQLEGLKRGELRWNAVRRKWEVFIPASAIKNGTAAFFRGRPYQITLPDFENLYRWIRSYIEIHRPCLLNGCRDPSTFFVRTLWIKARDAELDQLSFCNTWRSMIQRYGIYNPYTKRGAVKGLLPHGPHSVRDVIATHLLKRTGSYELASFALQISPEMTMRHYARFLPHEKIARAQEELDKVWRH